LNRNSCKSAAYTLEKLGTQTKSQLSGWKKYN
jgi:hypothetical protein